MRLHDGKVVLRVFSFSLATWHLGNRRNRHKMKTFALSIPETFRSFSWHSFYRQRRSPSAPGNHEDGGKKKKKVYKIFKSTETSPIARGNKFPLTFYFRFVRNAREWSAARTNDGQGRREKKKLQKEEDGEDVRWLKCRRGTSRGTSWRRWLFFVHERNCIYRDNASIGISIASCYRRS